MSDADLRTATAAMRHWAHGTASGDWSGLRALLDPDVTFTVPVEGFAGLQHGGAAAGRFFDRLAEIVRADLTVTQTLCAGSRTAFEVAVRGTMRGRPFTQALCLVFAVRAGRVVAFHEYLAWPGGLPPPPAGG